MGPSHVLARAPREGSRHFYGAGGTQFLDVYPARTASSVVVAAIHGGYWRDAYGLSHLSHLCAALAEVGVSTASLEYRRLGEPGGGWPGTLEDIRDGLEAVCALGPAVKTAAAPLLVLGHSAGGQLALWAASSPAARTAPQRPTPRPRGVIALAPLSDLAEAFRLGLSQNAVREFLGGSPEALPERYQDASPLERLPLGVSAVLLHGTADAEVPYAMSPAYVARARALGDDVRLLTLEGADHFDIIDPDSRFFPEVLRAIQSLR
jgi:acetyl esterase/lipase